MAPFDRDLPQPTVGSVVAALALLGASGVAALLLTSGRTALPAPPWLAVATAALLVGTLLLPERALARAGPCVAALVGVAASVAHLAPGVVKGHDTQHHLWGAWAWHQAWSAGDLLPIWLHHVGLGMPLPLFYGPLPFLAMAPAYFADAGVDRMLGSSFALAGVVGAVSTFLAVRAWTDDRRAALVAATAMAYAPYRLLDSGYRTALGETWAIALLPFVIFAFERLLDRPGVREFRLAATALGLVAISHPLSLLELVVLLPLLWWARRPPWRHRWRASLRAAWRGVAASFAGLALAAVFVLPLVVEFRETTLVQTIEKKGSPGYPAQGLHIAQLFERRLWSALEWAGREDADHPPAPEMPFYFGCLLFGTLVAASQASRLGSPRSGPLGALGWVGLTAIALSTIPFAQLGYRLAPWLATLQFPWRFLGPASVLAALALGLFVATLRTSRAGAIFAVLFALVALSDGFPHSGAVGRVPPWDGVAYAQLWSPGETAATSVPKPWPVHVAEDFLPPRRGRHEVGSVSAYREYLTPLARSNLRRPENAVGLRAADDQIVRPESFPYAWELRRGKPVPLRFERGKGTITLFPGRRVRRVEIAEQYFPGWQVETARGWREVVPNASGLLAADLGGPHERVRFRFDRWRPDRTAGWAVSILAVLGLALLGRRRGHGVTA